jgi:hypothetical protein
LAVQDIHRYRIAMPRVGRDPELPPRLRLDAVITHQLRNPLLITNQPFRPQRCRDPSQQLATVLITTACRASQLLLPTMQQIGADSQFPCHPSYTTLLLHHHPPEIYPCSVSTKEGEVQSLAMLLAETGLVLSFTTK